mmetsp:Transcript_20841/g.32150  ORF Transcript_20841/g.32150 Transcript_20841/m.32150 type:complete len:218 (-) Transcript_20841:533-1186(-)
MKQVVSRREVVVLVQGEVLQDHVDVELLEFGVTIRSLQRINWDLVLLDHLQDDLRVDPCLLGSGAPLVQLLHGLEAHLRLLAVKDLRLFKILNKPRVASYLLERESLLGVRIQNLLDEVLAGLGNVAGERILAVQYFLVELVRVRVFEGQVPTEHRVEDHSARPDINLEPVVLLTGDHFRRCIARTATSRDQGIARLIHIRQAEVDDLQVVRDLLQE